MAAKKTRKKAVRKPKVVDLTDIPMSFESPESGTIERASYDADQQVMLITFKTGHTYRYNAPPTIWVGFTEAGSKGAYFSKAIRPMYNGVQE